MAFLLLRPFCDLLLLMTSAQSYDTYFFFLFFPFSNNNGARTHIKGVSQNYGLTMCRIIFTRDLPQVLRDTRPMDRENEG
jgi:hypothetical protein